MKSESPKTLIAHTEDIRKYLCAYFFCFFCIFICIYIFSPKALDYLFSIFPERLYVTRIMEPVFLQIKFSLLVSFVASIPLLFAGIFYYLRNIFRVSLYLVIVVSLLASIFLILAMYFITPSFAMFFISFTKYQAIISVTDYCNFSVFVGIMAALVVLIPIIAVYVSLSPMIEYSSLKSKRKEAFLAAFILGAVLTPPDIISQIIFGIILYFVYEIIIVVKFFRKEQPRGH